MTERLSTASAPVMASPYTLTVVVSSLTHLTGPAVRDSQQVSVKVSVDSKEQGQTKAVPLTTTDHKTWAASWEEKFTVTLTHNQSRLRFRLSGDLQKGFVELDIATLHRNEWIPKRGKFLRGKKGKFVVFLNLNGRKRDAEKEFQYDPTWTYRDFLSEASTFLNLENEAAAAYTSAGILIKTPPGLRLDEDPVEKYTVIENGDTIYLALSLGEPFKRPDEPCLLIYKVLLESEEHLIHVVEDDARGPVVSAEQSDMIEKEIKLCLVKSRVGVLDLAGAGINVTPLKKTLLTSRFIANSSRFRNVSKYLIRDLMCDVRALMQLELLVDVKDKERNNASGAGAARLPAPLSTRSKSLHELQLEKKCKEGIVSSEASTVAGPRADTIPMHLLRGQTALLSSTTIDILSEAIANDTPCGDICLRLDLLVRGHGRGGSRVPSPTLESCYVMFPDRNNHYLLWVWLRWLKLGANMVQNGQGSASDLPPWAVAKKLISNAVVLLGFSATDADGGGNGGRRGLEQYAGPFELSLSPFRLTNSPAAAVAAAGSAWESAGGGAILRDGKRKQLLVDLKDLRRVSISRDCPAPAEQTLQVEVAATTVTAAVVGDKGAGVLTSKNQPKTTHWFAAVKGPHVQHVTRHVTSSSSSKGSSSSMGGNSSRVVGQSARPAGGDDEIATWGESVYFDVTPQDFSIARRKSAWGKLSAHSASRPTHRGFNIMLYRGSVGISKLVGYQFVPFSLLLPPQDAGEESVRKNEVVIPLVDPSVPAFEVTLQAVSDVEPTDPFGASLDSSCLLPFLTAHLTKVRSLQQAWMHHKRLFVGFASVHCPS